MIDRRHGRKPVTFTATVRTGELVFTARVINLSMGDAGLLSPKHAEVKANDIISIELYNDDGTPSLAKGKPIILAAKVKRVSPDPLNGPEAVSIGVIFPTFTPGLMAILS